MSSKGFVTKGTPEYFSKRATNIQSRLDEARAKIETIEARVRGEIDDIQTERRVLIAHLQGAAAARDALVGRRDSAARLIDELQCVVALCDDELPGLDEMLSALQAEGKRVGDRLDEAEKSRHRQLHKHERAKTRYEGRMVRLDLRKKLMMGEQPAEDAEANIGTVSAPITIKAPHEGNV